MTWVRFEFRFGFSIDINSTMQLFGLGSAVKPKFGARGEEWLMSSSAAGVDCVTESSLGLGLKLRKLRYKPSLIFRLCRR